MSHTYHHAVSSARLFGGKPEDYQQIHNWFDESKAHLAEARHRAKRHHAEGIFECEIVFGLTIKNSNGTKVPVRYIGEQHVKEDCGGFIPSESDWWKTIVRQPWMNRGYTSGDTSNARAVRATQPKRKKR